MQIDFNNICSNFYKYKELIIEVFINYYGEEYRELIKTKIENTYYNFSSSPDDDYAYMLANINNMKKEDILLIRLRYKKYKLVCNYIDKSIKKELLSFIDKKIGISIKNKEMQNEFLGLFTNEKFDKGLIDCYSSEINRLLNDNCLQEIIEKNILSDRKEIKEKFNKFNVDIENIDEKIIDEILSFRNLLNKKRLNYLATHSDVGHQIFNYFNKNYDLELNDDNLSFILFVENPFAGAVSSQFGTKEDIVFYKYMRLPITYLYGRGMKAYDVHIIHELIHIIENNGFVTGIQLDTNGSDESIFNEIRTQKLAIKITQQLHDMNIFIYDDPNDFKIYGESDYEYFFPLVEDFIEKYEELLSGHAINNDIDGVRKIFGPFFIDFYDRINEVYSNSTKYVPKNCKFVITSDEIIDFLMKKMKNYYSESNVKVKK